MNELRMKVLDVAENFLAHRARCPRDESGQANLIYLAGAPDKTFALHLMLWSYFFERGPDMPQIVEYEGAVPEGYFRAEIF
jgi:hypothetical protein